MTVAQNLVELLAAKGLTCATAESCTGGGVGSAITAIPGSSAVFAGGIISYANEVKERVLGVSRETLATVGAVSSETAAQMAEGARRLLQVDLAVALTGIAGPDGGTPEKPVGLVYLGCYCMGKTLVERHVFPGNRSDIRNAAVEAALTLAKKALKE